jgi:hypothetical protein
MRIFHMANDKWPYGTSLSPTPTLSEFKRYMLVSVGLDADFSAGGVRIGVSATYFSRPIPTAIRELTLGEIP